MIYNAFISQTTNPKIENMRKILFSAIYPSSDSIKEGMAQRIKAIDTEFEGRPRTYLFISLRPSQKWEYTKVNDKLTTIKCNFLCHYFRIRKLLRGYDFLYIHSLLNYRCLYFFTLKKKVITLDAHGVVPEEMEYAGSKMRSKIYQLFEKRIFRIASNLIFVSEEMKDFYIRKYSFISPIKIKVKPIFPKNSLGLVGVEDDDNRKNALRKELDIGSDNVVFVYSGSTAIWQNFPLMVQTIKRMKNHNYKFIVLTPEVERAKQEFSDNAIDLGKIIIRSVAPEQLGLYYSICHYGFILRDKHILNQVAAPTKLVEYLYFGLTPIVKSEMIGDALRLGYKYIFYTADIDNLQQSYSERNYSVAQKLLNKSIETSLLTLL